MTNDDMSLNNTAKEKILRLVDFLSALSHLSSKVIRSIDEYHKKMWIYEIPREKNCYTRVWGANEEHSDDVWIEIKKLPEPPLPKIPEKCRDWVDHDTLQNIKDIPLLKESITVIREEQNEETGEKYSSQLNLSLNEFPEIQKIWEEYIDKQWLPWTEQYSRYSAIQKVYADLFFIYQEQQKLGEQYELVFCFGLLSWRTQAGYETKRHLISAKASLSFEPHRGIFTVGPSADGDQVEVEFDMLDTGDLPPDSQKLKEGGRKLRDNLWERASMNGLLAAIANSLADGGQGEYFADHTEPTGNIGNKPLVEYAPALILRKRSMRGLEELLSEIRKQIEAGEKIPAEFLDLSEMLPEGKHSEIEHSESAVNMKDAEIYFPLLANEEQRRIILTLDTRRGVLVQGPPGTGKSHTIANLICHLLATGKRVLVTAKTPRALQVLHDKLPGDIKPLCINLLGSGPEEKESMEKSVRGILLKHDRWHNDEAINQIAQLERQVKDNREAKAETDAKIIALREQETYKHIIADGEYSGTAAEIARRLKQEETVFAWLQDTIAPDVRLPLSREEINCLCRDIVQIDNETERQLSLALPDLKTDLQETESLKSLFARENAGKELVALNAELLQSTEARVLLKVEKESVQLLTQSVSDLIIAIENIHKRPMEWIRNAVYDVLTDRDTPWRELLKHSSTHAKGLHELASAVYTYDITIPPDMDKKKLLDDAKALRSHFETGGGTGFLIFKPKPVRDHGDFIKKVKVDGSTCSDILTLNLMAWQLSMKQLGKGTGKHAHVHRMNAQQHLNDCRSAVPAWIMPLHRVYETVKAGPGIFDVIIVDEASQCGPEALPLLYLGERLLIVGDDKQISPEAVGVNRADVQMLIRNYLYDFSYASSFDIESSLFDHGGIRFGSKITLREHFRCMPEIIEFSNSLCYSTDPLIPLRQYPPDGLEPLRSIYVQKGYKEGEGQRVRNKPEAEALVNEVIRYCKDSRYQGMTMGVIVLQGEAQAYLIEEILLNRLGAEEMDKRRLICGNPYSFQGDERDVIFLSMVAAPNERIGVLTKESARRRFNVAASRARDQMILFHSVTANHLGGQCFRRRLLDYFYNVKPVMAIPLGEDALREIALRANRSIEKPPEPFDSWFEVDVALNIASRGFKVVPQFKFAYKRIDLVVQGNKAQFAVECDGDHWHGINEYAADMDRQRKLERCGWRFVRIRESQYYANPDTALDSLWIALERMGIQPFNEDQPEGTQQKYNMEGLNDAEEFDAGEEAFGEENDAEECAETELPEEPLTFFSDKDEGIPKNIQEALRVKPDILGKTIIEILHERPNETCVRDYMATYILKCWKIRTRGLPHRQFARKVADVIAVMARRGHLTVYKSKNWRIKMGWEPYQ